MTPSIRPISFLLLSILILSVPLVVHADTITGTVKDPSGGVVPGAHIEITGDGISQPIVFTTDESGKFAAPDLKSLCGNSRARRIVIGRAEGIALSVKQRNSLGLCRIRVCVAGAARASTSASDLTR